MKTILGVDGNTYRNRCKLREADVRLRSRGRCPRRRNCRVTRNIRYICGNDGRTYINESEARCYGVSVYKEGKCQD